MLPLRGQQAPIPEAAQAFIEAHFVAAKQAEAAGDLDRAAEEYRTILDKHPRLIPEVYQNLGLVYYLQRKHEDAIQTFSQGLRLKPGMVGAQLFTGSSYLYLEEPNKALPYLTTAHKLKPGADSARFLAMAESALGNYETAADHLRSALGKSGDPSNDLYLLGDCYQKLANRIGRSLIVEYPQSLYDSYLTAKILDSQGFFQVAAREYLDAARADPGNAAIFYPLARVLTILGQTDAAQLALDRYRQLAPRDASAALDPSSLPRRELANLGVSVDYERRLNELPPVNAGDLPPLPLLNQSVNSLLRTKLARDSTGKWKQAAKRLLDGQMKEAIPLLEGIPPAPGDWLRDYLMATAFVWLDDYASAEKILRRRAVQAAPQPDVRFLRWEVFQQLSLTYFQRLLDEHPRSARAHFVKARALDAEGKREALEEYDAAIAADPKQPEVRLYLADFHLSNSRHKEALEACQGELDLNPLSSGAKARIGKIYVQIREPDKALPYLTEALKINPNDAEAWADLARAHELGGELEKSLLEYHKALELDPSLNRLHYVLARLYRRMGKAELADKENQLFQKNESDERKLHLERLDRVRSK